MTNVMAEIKSWAKTLKYWEQAILDKIIDGKPFTDGTYQELCQYLLEDEGLIEQKSTRPQLQSLSEQNIPQEPSGQIRLTKISNLKGVNALAPNQTLTFGPALTAIFGANASGKSASTGTTWCEKLVLDNAVAVKKINVTRADNVFQFCIGFMIFFLLPAVGCRLPDSRHC